MDRKFIFLWLSFIAFFPILNVGGQQTVGLFTKDNGVKDGYVLFSPNASGTNFLIDRCGKLVHQWKTKTTPGLDAYLLPIGNLLTTGNTVNSYFNSQGALGGLVELYDWNGNLLWSYLISDSIHKQDHDVYPMPNGNILVLEWERHLKSDAIASGMNNAKALTEWCTMVQEITPIGKDSAKIVWEWRLWDHLVQNYDSTKANYGLVADHPELMNINYDGPGGRFGVEDWIHANSVSYNAQLDQVMISSRNISEIWIIDHSTTTVQAANHSGGIHNKGGDFLYRWGNPAAYGRGTSSSETLFEQHNANWIPKGYPDENKIMVFNNGATRPSGPYSSSDIFSPPIDSNGNYFLPYNQPYGPAIPSWRYKAPIPSDFYSSTQGGSQRLSNGNTLICEANKGNFFEIDTANNLVWKYINPVGSYGPVVQGNTPVGNADFRCTFYDMDYGAFKNKTIRPGNPIELSPINNNCFMPFLLAINPIYKIRDLKGYNQSTGVADSLGKGKGYIKGIVSSQNFNIKGNLFSCKDSTGAIMVISTKNSSYNLMPGDSIVAGGSVSQTNGVTQYLADTILFINSGNRLSDPRTVNSLDESSESDIVKIKNVHIVDTTEWNQVTGLFDVHVTNRKDTFVMRISMFTDLYHQRQFNETFNVTGISLQDKKNLPYLGNYIIEPRGFSDIEHVDQLYSINQLRSQNNITGVSDSIRGHFPFYTKGIVQSLDFTKPGYNFSLMDSTGSIFVTGTPKNISYNTKIGDSILIHGYLVQNFGVTAVNIDSVFVLNNPISGLHPKIILRPDESTEAELVQFNNAWLINPSQWNSSGMGFNALITNGTDTINLYISSQTDMFGKPSPKGLFCLTGIASQFKTSAPYFGGYILMPRGSGDFKFIPYPYYKIKYIKSFNAITGVSDSLDVVCMIKGVVQSGILNINNNAYFSFADSTGAIMILKYSALINYHPNSGDSLIIMGIVKQNEGVTIFIPDSIGFVNNGSLPLSRVITTLGESTESSIIQFKNAWLVDPSQWATSGSGFLADVTNGLDTLTLYISNSTDIVNNPPPHKLFNVTGIGAQNKEFSPFFGGYFLIPRGSFDFAPSDYHEYAIREIRKINSTTGEADSLNLVCAIKGIVQSRIIKCGNNSLFSLEDSTGAIMISNLLTENQYSLEIGDSLTVRGEVKQINGLIIFEPDSLINTGKGNVSDPETTLTLNELTESSLIRFKRVWLVDSTQWTANLPGFFAEITNGRDTINMYISSSTDMYFQSAPRGLFDVSGIGSQDKPSLPYIGGYFLMPRGQFDFWMIPYPIYKIREIKGFNSINGVADSIYVHCLLEGIVQSRNLSGNSSAFFSIGDSTGAIILNYSESTLNYSPKTGDSMKVCGMVNQENGLTLFKPDSIIELMSGTVKTPLEKTVLDENSESELVKFSQYRLVNPNQWDTTNANGQFNVLAYNATDTITLKIMKGTDLYTNDFVPQSYFDVTGIGYQDDSSSPYFQDYFLIPRTISDFQHSTGVEPEKTYTGQLTVFPNPASNIIHIISEIKMRNLKLSDIYGKTISDNHYNDFIIDLDINALPEGMYIIKVNYGTTTLKVIKN